LSGLDIILPHEREHEVVNWYLYTISSKNRNKILKKLNSRGIGASVYYSLPIHKTPFYNNKVKLPVTEWASSSVISLPVHPLVSKQNLYQIAKIMRQAVKK
jgi:dTDP-4-amino-4,6-dideoxygalactose transaminase